MSTKVKPKQTPDDILSLADLKVGEKGEIVHVNGASAIKRRLIEMGIVAGARVEVERVAPLGDPVEIKIMGYKLSLRNSETRNIRVRKIG